MYRVVSRFDVEKILLGFGTLRVRLFVTESHQLLTPGCQPPAASANPALPAPSDLPSLKFPSLAAHLRQLRCYPSHRAPRPNHLCAEPTTRKHIRPPTSTRVATPSPAYPTPDPRTKPARAHIKPTQSPDRPINRPRLCLSCLASHSKENLPPDPRQYKKAEREPTT
jgi:hypothetical protein